MQDAKNLFSRRQKKDEEELDLEPDYQPVNWKKLLFSWKTLPLWLVAIAVVVLVILISVDKNQIVAKLTPISQKIHDIPAGWIIPIVVLFVLSFPPLFGHEIIALLCGVVWGLWVGFGIVAAGTFIGEIGTWFAFKYVLRRRAYRLERTNLTYGALARLTRESGFWMIVVVRLSVVPSHISTAVFSTCDVNFWHFVIATFLSLPKQLIVVYIGTLIVGGKSETLVKALVFIIGFGFTVGVSWYIFKKLRYWRKVLLEEQDQRRADKERQRLQLEQPAAGATAGASHVGELERAEPSGQSGFTSGESTKWPRTEYEH